MKNFPYIALFFLVTALLLTLLLPTKTIAGSYFNDTLVVEVTHAGFYASDKVTLAITEPGTYDVSFFPLSSRDNVPNSFSITYTADEVPVFKTVKKYSINNFKLTIVKDGISETHEFKYSKD